MRDRVEDVIAIGSVDLVHLNMRIVNLQITALTDEVLSASEA